MPTPSEALAVAALWLRMTMIDAASLSTIEAILRKGDRVEIIPVKDGVKIVRIHREIAKSVEKWLQSNTEPASKR